RDSAHGPLQLWVLKGNVRRLMSEEVGRAARPRARHRLLLVERFDDPCRYNPAWVVCRRQFQWGNNPALRRRVPSDLKHLGWLVDHAPCLSYSIHYIQAARE